jgi:hypothetical protein
VSKWDWRLQNAPFADGPNPRGFRKRNSKRKFWKKRKEKKRKHVRKTIKKNVG